MSERHTSTTVTTVDDRPTAHGSTGGSGEGGGADGAGDRTLGAEHTGSATPQREPLTPGQSRWLIAILAVATIVRVAWLAYAHVDPPVWYIPSGDSFSYWYYGNEIAAGHGYVSYITGDATAYYPIGFPAILGGVYWLANHVPFVDPDLMMVTGGFQIIIAVATVALTFVVGRRLFGPRAGLIAAGIMALFPNLIYQVTTIQVETTFIFLTMAALAILVDHGWSSGPPSRSRLFAFGIVLSISALVRPFSTPLLIGLLFALLAVGVGWRRALVAVSLPLLIVVAAFIPWTVRNAMRMDAFVPSSTNMGDTLCIDRNDEADGGFRWTVHDGCVDPDLPEAERNRGNTRKAIDFIVDNPDRELLQIGRRARIMFADDHDGIIATEGLGSGPILSDGSRRVYTSVADWYFRVVLAAAVVGLALAVRRSPRPERRLVVTTTVTLLIIPLLLWGNPRFHNPLVPFLAISAAGVVAAVVSRFAGTGAASPASGHGDGPGQSRLAAQAAH